MQRAQQTTALVVAGLVVAACSYSPRNGQRLARFDSPVTWAGGTNKANEGVLLMHANAQNFSTDTFAAGARTSASATHHDQAGIDWFTWSQEFTVPRGFWKKTGPREMQARVKTVTMNSQTGALNAPLISFDIGAATDSCLQSNESRGLQTASAVCASPQAGIVTLTSPCGTLGDACCETSCDSGLACYNNTFRCVKTPGSTCAANSECSPLDSCFAGVCSQQAWLKIGSTPKPLFTPKTFSFPSASAPRGSVVEFRPYQAPNQSVTILDWPYGISSMDNGGSNMVGDMTAGKWACLPARFTTINVAPNQSLSPTLSHSSSFAVRHNHGTCSTRIPWKQTFFEPFSAQFQSTAEEVLKERLPNILKPFTKFSRDWDVGQVQFRSDGTTHQWGFFYLGAYNITALGTNTRLEVAPGYSFAPGPVDGFVQVTSLNQGVSLIPDVSQARPGITEALRDDVPKVMMDIIRSRMEMPVSLVAQFLNIPNVGDQSCTRGNPDDPNRMLFEQNTCLPKVRAALGAAGSVLTAKHVSCGADNQCAVHPPVQAVNVLPESLELVFAPDMAGGADTLTNLYRSIPGLCQALPAQGVQTGLIATLHHGDNAHVTGCGPILP